MYAYQQMLAVISLSFFGLMSLSCESFQPSLVPQETIPKIAKTLPWWIQIVEQNPDCGLPSADVSQKVEIEGVKGQKGRATWRQEGCHISLTTPVTVSSACGAETTLTGSFSIVFEKSVNGWVTDSLTAPILYDHDSRETYWISIINLNVNIKDPVEDVVFKGEKISLSASFPVVSGARNGICDSRASTPKTVAVNFSDLSMESLGSDESRRFESVHGNFQFGEGFLDGYLSNASDLLSFSLDEQEHPWTIAGSACDNENQVENRETLNCNPRTAIWSQEAVRSSFPMVHSIIELMERNPECGFQSANVVEHSTWNGEVGGADEEAVYEIYEPCLLELRADTPIEENCHGETTLAQGTAWVSGIKRTKGWLTGHPIKSVIPDRAQHTAYELEIRFENFQWAHPGWDPLHIKSGLLEVSAEPKFVFNQENGICDVRTPEMTVSSLRWSDAYLTADKTEGAFHLQIIAANAQGIRGSSAVNSNRFSGEVNVEGEVFNVPLSQKSGLIDESYVKFIDSYKCRVKVDYSVGAAGCDYLDVLGAHAAKMLLEAFSKGNEQIEANEACGFSSDRIFANPTVAAADDLETYVWAVDSCSHEAQADFYNEDCLGQSTYVAGGLSYSGQRQETGKPVSSMGWQGVLPQTFDALSFHVSQMLFEDFDLSFFNIDGASEREGVLIEQGTLRGTYEPIRGLNDAVFGIYDIRTPVARFKNLQGEDLKLKLRLNGQQFSVDVSSVFLNGQRGAFEGESPALSGRIRVNGRWVHLNHSFASDYEQAHFDSSYICQENLTALIPKD